MSIVFRFSLTVKFSALLCVKNFRCTHSGNCVYTIFSDVAVVDITASFALIAIGLVLVLTLIYLLLISVTNTSVNPARSTGVALFQGLWAIEQLWLFWVAPIVGAIIGAIIYRTFGNEK